MTDAVQRGLSLRLAGLTGVIFCGYGIAATASQMLFLEAYGAAALPSVWAAVGVGSVLAVGVVSLMLRRLSVVRALYGAAWGSAGCFAALLVAQAQALPGAIYLLFVFKDVYIMVLSELFWATANSEFAQSQAMRTYGLFCAAGSLGAAAGNLIAGPLAAHLGLPHAQLLQACVPLCLLAALGVRLCAPRLRQTQGAGAPPPGASLTGLWPALQVVRGSRLLPWLLVLVLTAQISITVVEYQFNQRMEVRFADPAARQAAFGQVMAFINGLSLALQLCTGPIVRALGAGGVLWAVPLSLLSCLSLALALPSFAGIALVRIVSKSNDYSLFRTVKELLYIPLSQRERTLGKAVIDILIYRLAKAPAAALIWAAWRCGGEVALGLLSAGLCALWLALTGATLRRQTAAPCDDPPSCAP